MPRFSLKKKTNEGGWSEKTIAMAKQLSGPFNPLEVSHLDFCQQLSAFYLKQLADMTPRSPTRLK